MIAKINKLLVGNYFLLESGEIMYTTSTKSENGVYCTSPNRAVELSPTKGRFIPLDTAVVDLGCFVSDDVLGHLINDAVA